MTDSTQLDGAEICEFEGHEWSSAGGGLLMCMRCAAERWAEAGEVDDEEGRQEGGWI